MAKDILWALVRYLEHLTPEELKKFKLYLKDEPSGRCIPRGRVEGADRTELAELLVNTFGKRKAWNLTKKLLKKTGLRGLWERARKEILLGKDIPAGVTANFELSLGNSARPPPCRITTPKEKPLRGWGCGAMLDCAFTPGLDSPRNPNFSPLLDLPLGPGTNLLGELQFSSRCEKRANPGGSTSPLYGLWEQWCPSHDLRDISQRPLSKYNPEISVLFVVTLDERNKYRERMKEKFQLMRERNSRPGEHELFHHRFTQLLLLRGYRYKEQKHHELLVYGWEHTEFMQERGQLIEMVALFDPFKETGVQPRTVVLQGAAGIGKTTLASKVMLDWAEGNLFQERFDYVFYLTCRELNPLGEREISFADLIANDWPGPKAPMAEIMSQPERLLFIIDGLDELKFPCNEHRYDLCKDWKQKEPVSILLSSLLRKTLLPEACLLLTTRLTALGKFCPLLESPRHVEILGFSVQQRKEYFCKFFRDKDLGKKAFHLVKGNDTLFTMCSVPLMNWVVCTCLKQQMEKGQDPVQALKTTTALYMCYLSNLIIPDDKNFIPQHLRGLCRLAAEGIWDRKLLFEEEDLRRNTLEAADVSAFLDMNLFQKDSGCENCYSFIHLSFQEFFAAIFYVMNTEKEGMKSSDASIPGVRELLEECSGLNSSFVVLVVRFLFGFLNVETAKELERKFRCRMSLKIKSQLLQWAQGETERNIQYHQSMLYFREFYSHLYETQDSEFVTQVLDNIQEIKVQVYHQYDALNAAFCIKHCYKARKISFYSNFGLPAGIWQELFSIVNKNPDLKELMLGSFEFDDSCMENLCKELNNPNCKLEKLTLADFKVTYSSCQHLFSAPSLKSLHLKGEIVKNDDMKLPRETLRKTNCQLEILRITHFSSFTVNVLDFFSAENLKSLHLFSTYIQEDVVELLKNVLAKQDCQLPTISLVNCLLQPTFCYKLFSVLGSSKSLKNLDLSLNFFGKEEIKCLCKTMENQVWKLETLSPHLP
ncbi:NACHT, LRR and PYD domains-containing protein 12 [Sarcophilus harrisii]|uniref:NACHT, LRR and PYD domains-containing protein 12 n=1 Tax=Sarcophilus harrisii TaxID=9305 RepID=UPI001301EEA0|nr:NACHT, LRR and PYD domains-containing protein 12 [Sarcophilus harrisii]